jgi:hypothetical protein
MALIVKDRVKQAAAAPGTGTITLGSTPTGFQSFAAVGDTNTTYFAIVDPVSGAWEVNFGVYTLSGTTLTRNATPLSSSNSGALVNFTGAVDVFVTYPSEKAVYEDTAGVVTFTDNPILSGGTANGVLYLNGSKVATSGSALTFNGTSLGIGSSSYGDPGNISVSIGVPATTSGGLQLWSTTSGGSFVQFGDGTTGSDTYRGYVGYNHALDALLFGAATAEGLRLTSSTFYTASGISVGIGTNLPAQKLHVNVASGSVYEQISSGSNNVYVGFDSAKTAGVIQSNNALTFDVGSSYTQRMVIDTSGNLGLGITPSAAWASSAYLAAQFGYGGVIMSSQVSVGVTVLNIGANFKYDGSDYRRINAEEASQYQQVSGTHNWRIAASSTANSVITWTQAMTLDASGNLEIGATDTTGSRLSFGKQFIGNNGYANAIRVYDDGGVSTSITSNSYGFGFSQNSLLSYTAGTGGDHAFYGANTERFRITSAGDVGIGRAPNYKFDVSATSDTVIAMNNSASVTSGNRGNILMYNSANTTVGLIRFGAVTDNVGTDIQFYTRPAAGSLTQTMTLSSIGNLTVNASAGLAGNFQNVDATNGYGVSVAAGGTSATRYSLVVRNPAGTQDWFKVSSVTGEVGNSIFAPGAFPSSEIARFTTTGLGIGTNNPLSKLHVAGDALNGTAMVRYDVSSQNSSFNWVSTAFASNMTASTNLIHFIGQAGSTRNAAYLGFKYDSSGSYNNLLTLGLYAADNLLNINGYGNVSLSGATTSADGIGITFPATQSASSNANTLDDYEEGTWTVTDNSGAGLTFTVNYSQYTKIGRAVTINAEINWPSTANTSNVAVSLPIPPNTAARTGMPAFSNVAGEVNFYLDGGANFVLYNDTGTLITNATMSSKYLIVSFTYFV